MMSTWERMIGRPTVVVGVDGSAGSLAAITLAATEAELRGLPLCLLSVHRGDPRLGPGTSLTGYLRRVCTTWPHLTVTGRNVSGDPATVLVEASRAADLVVLGRSGTGAPRPDSVGVQVAAHAFSPTLIVPPAAAAPTGGPVLLALGTFPDEEPAIAFAFEEAALRGVPLLAVHVWSGVPAVAVGAINPFAYDLREAQAAADRTVAEVLAGWADKYPDVEVDRMPLYDISPTQALLDAETLADLVVVAARRDEARGSQLLGGVTSTLIGRATRPVAVVHPAAIRESRTWRRRT